MRKIAAFLAAIIAAQTLGASVPHVDFRQLPAWMNEPFYRTIWDTQRFNVWIGGAGSGKSIGAAQRDVYRMTAEPGHNYMIVRKVGDSNRYSTFSTLVGIIDAWNLLPLYDISESTMVIRNRYNGNECIFRGMNDVRARERVKSVNFKSGPLTDVRLEEASEFEREDFLQLNLRLRGRAARPFQMTLTFNPISVDHWIKSEFFDNPKLNASILRTTYQDNRFIDAGYRAELEAMRESDPTLYQVYALGEWGQLGDQAFPNVVFDASPYTVAEYDRVVFGQDFGFQHYNAIEGIGVKDGELYSFAELYVRQKVNSDVIAMAGPVLPRDTLCIADSAEPKSIEEWRRAGFCIDGAKKGPDSVAAGFAFLRGRKWHIDPVACPGLAAEVRGAVYRKDKSGRATEDIFSFHDDALAACRYAAEYLSAAPAAFNVVKPSRGMTTAGIRGRKF